MTRRFQQMPAESPISRSTVLPARRMGQPGEIASLVACLCTEDAGYLNLAEIDGDSWLCPMVLGSMREVRAWLRPSLGQPNG